MTNWTAKSSIPEPDGSWGPGVNIRSDRPTPARIYDYFLGGKDNFPVDREAAEKVKEAVGAEITSDAARENRLFLRRVVRWLAEAGIDQFIDVGAGLPTQGNVHEIVQQVNPDAHIVYVDNDPIVLAHGRALLADNATTTVITADLRSPGTILDHPDLRTLIDFSRPVAILFIAVFHFVTDEEDPAGLIAAFRKLLAPGSHIALTHAATDDAPSDQVARVEQVYKNATSPFVFRSRQRIEALFAGFDLVEPGIVHPWQWRPGEDDIRTAWQFAGVARKSAQE
ncbi:MULTISPECIES: SAM-dependent methyltransferase [unclassified Frankia]|uniref:SAM-dependent methyltransferase n=1 Tax=unclassified Frankia TaxID=2632575 RepID=UPI0020245F29